MAAIITDQIRLLNASNFVAGVTSTTNAYLSLSENQQRELQNKVWTKADRINRALYNVLK